MTEYDADVLIAKKALPDRARCGSLVSASPQEDLAL